MSYPLKTYVCDEIHVSEETHVSDKTHVSDDSPDLLHVTSKHLRSPLNRTQLLLDLQKMLYVTATCATLKCLIWSFGQPNTHNSGVL